MSIRQNLILVLALVLLNTVHAQENPTEIDIKRSGKFFWGQAYDIDSSKACMIARDDLMYKISNEIDLTHKLSSKMDILVNCIKYLIKPVEELSEVIAYVNKSDVKNIAENKSVLCVHEIKYTEENKKTHQLTSEDSLQIYEEPITETNQKKGIMNEPEVENTPDEPISNFLLDRLIHCNTASELKKILEKESQNNTVIYNWDSELYRSRVSSEGFFIVLIDPENNKIIAFLDKGLGKRKDLKNKGRVITETEMKKSTQIWIQIM